MKKDGERNARKKSVEGNAWRKIEEGDALRKKVGWNAQKKNEEGDASRISAQEDYILIS